MFAFNTRTWNVLVGGRTITHFHIEGDQTRAPPQLNIYTSPLSAPRTEAHRSLFQCFQLDLEILGVVVHNRSPWH
jgi:hypothetical protein